MADKENPKETRPGNEQGTRSKKLESKIAGKTRFQATGEPFTESVAGFLKTAGGIKEYSSATRVGIQFHANGRPSEPYMENFMRRADERKTGSRADGRYLSGFVLASTCRSFFRSPLRILSTWQILPLPATTRTSRPLRSVTAIAYAHLGAGQAIHQLSNLGLLQVVRAKDTCGILNTTLLLDFPTTPYTPGIRQNIVFIAAWSLRLCFKTITSFRSFLYKFATDDRVLYHSCARRILEIWPDFGSHHFPELVHIRAGH
ncbi:hypothetical protein C8R44DRAFT_752380 [Mycena epipterygia]|nr:hypothetical protein C8R44DRAFT_752380 [Mycena epipterygia]